MSFIFFYHRGLMWEVALRANLSKSLSQNFVIASAAKQSRCKVKIASSPTAPRNEKIVILRQVGA